MKNYEKYFKRNNQFDLLVYAYEYECYKSWYKSIFSHDVIRDVSSSVCIIDFWTLTKQEF